jgi:hypothetical protein
MTHRGVGCRFDSNADQGGDRLTEKLAAVQKRNWIHRSVYKQEFVTVKQHPGHGRETIF